MKRGKIALTIIILIGLISGVANAGTPYITSPADGSTLSGSSQTFYWTNDGKNVSQWWLYVGSYQGGKDILDSGSLGTATNHSVTGLPTDGSTVYVRLWYQSGEWWYEDFQYTAYTGSTGTPEITSPVPGSTLSGATVTFSWSANGTSVAKWWLYVGSSVGAKDIHDSGDLGTSTSTTVSGLPTDGSTVYVTLWYYSGGWQSVDFQFTAYTGSTGTPEITSPVPGSTLSGATVTFSWSANGTSVTKWWLYVGSSLGGEDIHDSGDLGTSTSTTVSDLPTDGSTVYVTLWYYSGGWQSVDFQFTAYTGSTGTPEITSPVPGSTLSGATVTFSWSANGTSVAKWWLYVGSWMGGADIHNSGDLGTGTSTTVSGLPTDGSTVYVTLWYYSGGWQSVEAQYTAYNSNGDDHPDSCSNAADIWPHCVWDSTNGYYECTIQGSIETAGDVDWFKLEVWSWGAMAAETTGSTNTYGAVYRAPCGSAAVVEDNDSGDGSNFRVGPVAASGGETLYLKIRHYSTGGTGNYTLIFIWDPWI